MVDAIAAHHPRLIFLDLSISLRGTGSQAAEDLDRFAEALWRVRSDGITVLIGQIDDASSQTYLRCPDGTDRLGGNTAPRLACAADKAVPIRWEDDVGLIWYPLLIGNDGPHPDLSPAATIVQTMVPGSKSEQLSQPQYDIMLAWPRGGRPGTQGLPGTQDCWNSEPQIGRGLLERSLDALASLFGSEETWPDKLCTYVPSLLMWEVLNEPAANPDLLLKDRAVIVGVSFRGSQDMRQPPQGPEVSGAFYHATAVENLITLGIDGVPRYEPYEPGANTPETLLAVFLIAIVTLRELITSVFLVFILTVRNRIASVLRLSWFAQVAVDRRLRRCGRWLVLRLTAMVAAMVLAVLTFEWFRRMPSSNVFATIIVVFVIETIVELVGKVHEFFIPEPREPHK